MTTETIHTCSYSCERPGCIRAQRDELAARLMLRFDLSPAQQEGAIREHLIRLGWTPPDEHAVSQPAAPSETVNVIGMPEFDSLLDHIYEYGTAAEGVIERANAFARAVIARYAPQQPSAVDEAAAIRAFEEHFEASAEDPYFEGELELWLTAWRKALATQQQEPTT